MGSGREAASTPHPKISEAALTDPGLGELSRRDIDIARYLSGVVSRAQNSRHGSGIPLR